MALNRRMQRFMRRVRLRTCAVLASTPTSCPVPLRVATFSNHVWIGLESCKDPFKHRSNPKRVFLDSSRTGRQRLSDSFGQHVCIGTDERYMHVLVRCRASSSELCIISSRREGPSVAPLEGVCIAILAVLQILHRCVVVGLAEGVMLAHVHKLRANWWRWKDLVVVQTLSRFDHSCIDGSNQSELVSIDSFGNAGLRRRVVHLPIALAPSTSTSFCSLHISSCFSIRSTTPHHLYHAPGAWGPPHPRPPRLPIGSYAHVIREGLPILPRDSHPPSIGHVTGAIPPDVSPHPTVWHRGREDHDVARLRIFPKVSRSPRRRFR